MRVSRLWRRIYLFAVVLLVAGQVAVRPVSAAPGESQVPAPNPDLAAACGIDIDVILDESGSIASSGATGQVRQAFKSFTRALSNTGSRLAVSEFSTVARLPLPAPATDQYTPVTDATIRDIFDPYIEDSYDPDGSTNWEDGFRMGRYFLPRPTAAKPLLTVFITDGDPSAVINTSRVSYDPGNPNVTQNQYELLEPLSSNQTTSAESNAAALPAISNANGIKAQGSHILALAVGAALTNPESLARMIAVSGLDVYDGSGTFDISTTDVYRVADFDQLESALRDAAFGLCAPSVTVRKLTDLDPDPSAEDLVPGAGWDLTASVSPTPDAWVLPEGATGATATAATDASGFANFQWTTAGTQTSTITVSEEDPAGVPPGFEYDQEATECTVRTPDEPDDRPLTVDVTDFGFTAEVPFEAIVTCDMVNRAVALPAVTIEKTTNGVDADDPPGPFVPVGEPVQWEHTVTNTGNVALSDIEVVDDPRGEVTCPSTTLEPGESMVCTDSDVAEAGAYENTGTVTALDPAGTQVTDSDPSHYTGSVAGLDIEKSTNGEDANLPPGPIVPVGDPVTWTYVVTNTGTETISGITVTDDQGVVVTCPTESLAAGESMTCTAPEDVAEPGLYTNVSTVAGTNAGGTTVQDSDPSHYFGEDPSIQIEKTTNGQDADTPPGPEVNEGGPVAWLYTVTNTGNVPLTWSVQDNPDVTVRCPNRLVLRPGDEVSCFAVDTSAQAGQYSNIATATGVSPLSGATVTDTDPSHYFGVQAGIEIVKLTNGRDANRPPGPPIPVGDPVTWTYVVTNTGNAALTDVEVVDDRGPTVTCPQSTLAVGETMECTATGTSEAGAHTNFGTVTATTPTGLQVSDDDPSNYFGGDPGIHLRKLTNGVDAPEPTGPFIEVGQPVQWTYVVTNTGNEPLANVVVTDDQGVTVTCPDGLLAPGADRTCTASGTAEIGQHQNIGTARGTTPTGQELTADYPSHYFGWVQSIQVKKFVNGQDAQTRPGPSVRVGSELEWTFEVTNTGNVPIIDVTLTDDQGLRPRPVGGAGRGNLDPDETWRYEATSTARTGTHRNVATVDVLDQLENELTDSDPANYTGEAAPAGISITKGPEHAVVDKGASHTFSIVVTNTGEVTLTNVQVTDARTPSCDRAIGTLAPAATDTYSCTLEHVQETVHNVAVVRGSTPSGGTVDDSDGATVTVEDKRPDLPNTGGSPLGLLLAGLAAISVGSILSGLWYARRRRGQLG
jgi:hypothetical protein